MGIWERLCYQTIIRGLIECQRVNLDRGFWVYQINSSFYPFGSRENYPYFIWCREMKHLHDFLAESTTHDASNYSVWRSNRQKSK